MMYSRSYQALFPATHLAPIIESEVRVCFIDYQKAFDNIRHDLLMPILQETSIDEKEIQIIHELYWNHIVKFRFNYTSQSNNIRIANRPPRMLCLIHGENISAGT